MLFFVYLQHQWTDNGPPGVPGLPAVRHAAVALKLVNVRVTTLPQPVEERLVGAKHLIHKPVCFVIVKAQQSKRYPVEK